MKDTKTILLLLVTLGLVSTWAYYIYDKNNYSNAAKQSAAVDSVAIQNTINDSLRRMFARTLNDLGVTDVAKGEVSSEQSAKVREIDSLRNEIASILNVASITKEDLRRAEKKIIELQRKMIAGAKKGITYTKAKEDVTPANNFQGQTVAVSQTVAAVQKEITPVSAPPPAETGSFVASDISIKAVQQDDKTTSKASQVNYFAVSCQLKNPKASYGNTDIYIVLTDPLGNVIQDDQWQAGMFSSNTDGRIPYTRKSSFDYTKGDSKRMNVTVKIPEVSPGAYNLQLYHNGNRIGKADIRLN